MKSETPTPYNPHYQTVLVSKQDSQSHEISSDHPLFYYREKNYFLNELANKISTENKFNSMDLKRNVRVKHFIEKHEMIQKQLEKERKRKNMFLNSDDFVPISGVGISQEEKQASKKRREEEKLRDELYRGYILREIETHEKPERDVGRQAEQNNVSYEGSSGAQINTSSYSFANEDYSHPHREHYLNPKPLSSSYSATRSYPHTSQPTTIIHYDDPQRKKELYLLDIEIDRIKEEQKLEQLVKSNSESCTNNELLSKISNTIMSSYMVYFDEIYDLLIDEILEEEVVYLNGIEAGYMIGDVVETNSRSGTRSRGNENESENCLKKNIKNQSCFEEDAIKETATKTNNKYQSKQYSNDPAAELRAAKMMELVRQLDELAED